MFIQKFLAVQLPHMLFTGLEDYKARGTQATPYFSASFYTEFAESKELVLIRGDIVFTSKLSDEEAKWLLETTLSFYLNDVRYKHVILSSRMSYEPRHAQSIAFSNDICCTAMLLFEEVCSNNVSTEAICYVSDRSCSTLLVSFSRKY